jgi:hypothetical protein
MKSNLPTRGCKNSSPSPLHPLRHLVLFVVCFPPRSTRPPFLFANCLLSHPLNFTIPYAPQSPMQIPSHLASLRYFAHHSSCYRFKFEDTFAIVFIYFMLLQSKCFPHFHVTLISQFLYISRILHAPCDRMNTAFFRSAHLARKRICVYFPRRTAGHAALPFRMWTAPKGIAHQIEERSADSGSKGDESRNALQIN